MWCVNSVFEGQIGTHDRRPVLARVAWLRASQSNALTATSYGTLFGLVIENEYPNLFIFVLEASSGNKETG
jgi:hypothetical protein